MTRGPVRACEIDQKVTVEPISNTKPQYKKSQLNLNNFCTLPLTFLFLVSSGSHFIKHSRIIEATKCNFTEIYIVNL